MKIDIKNIIDGPELTGEHWLADGVENEPRKRDGEQVKIQDPQEAHHVDTEADSGNHTGSITDGAATAADDLQIDGSDAVSEPERDLMPEEPHEVAGAEILHEDDAGLQRDDAEQQVDTAEPESAATDSDAADEKASEFSRQEMPEPSEVVEIDEAVEFKDGSGSSEPPGRDDKTARSNRIWLAAIAAAFVMLLAVTYIYNTMIPREVNALVDDKSSTIVTKAHTMEELLEEQGIQYCDKDYLSVQLSTYVSEGLSFELEHAKDFNVTADGGTKQYKSLCETVGDALEDCGVKVGKLDIVKPGRDTVMSENLDIVIKRVEFKEKTIVEKIAFDTRTKEDSSMEEGKTKVLKKGRNGKAKVTYRIKYVDGKAVSKKKISKKVIKKPVDKVVAKGTGYVFDGSSYSRKLTVRAYAYTGGGTTAMGTPARVGEIAVDPGVIPLGSTVYIEGVGLRTAEDTGGNIKGNTIDIYMNSQSECINWGVRYVTIYIK